MSVPDQCRRPTHPPGPRHPRRRLAGRRSGLNSVRLAVYVGSLVFLAFGQAHLALANWAYTTWGMTPEQVAAASNGAVHVLPPDKRTRDDADNWEVAAEGTYQDQTLPPLSTGFMFDTRNGGLVCVMFNSVGPQAETLPAKLEQRYGKPAKQSEFYTTKSTMWHTPDDVELVVNQKPLAAAFTHCQAGR